MRTIRTWHYLLWDRSGAVLPIFAMLLAVLLVTAGFGLDYGRALKDRSNAQAVADAMVLAMAQELRLGGSEDAARDAARRIYDTHYGSGSEAVTLEIRVLDNGGGYEVSVAFSDSTRATLMQLAKVDKVPWQVSAVARVGLQDVELTFVVDISNSMLEPGRMEELRSSLHRLVQIVFPDGRRASNRVVTLVPFSETVNLGTDPEIFAWLDTKRYQMDEKTRLGVDPVLIDPETGQNRILNFIGCFRREDASTITDPGPTGLGKLAPFVQTLRGRYPYCPSDSSKVLYFENDPSRLRAAIDRLENGYSTGTDEGLLWGWRTLSPRWRGKFPASGTHPLSFSASKKILIVLTDGVIQPMDPYGDWSPDDTLSRVKNGLERMSSLCDAIRREGQIEVHTVLYALPEMSGDGVAAQSIRLLRDCAANGGRYYHAAVSTLTATLEQILASINPIRLRE